MKYSDVKIKLFNYTIPAQTITYARVIMPSGKVYIVRSDMVHPGNFEETATILNSSQLLDSFWFNLVYDKYDCCAGINSEVWSNTLPIPMYDVRGCAYRCGKWKTVYPDKWRAMKLECVRLLKNIKDNGGIMKYNNPKEAFRILKNMTVFGAFAGCDQGRWLLNHFNINL